MLFWGSASRRSGWQSHRLVVLAQRGEANELHIVRWRRRRLREAQRQPRRSAGGGRWEPLRAEGCGRRDEQDERVPVHYQ